MLFWSTFHLRKFGWFKFVIFKFRCLQTSFRNPRLSQIEKFEYQVCSAHQDLQSLYRLFFHLRKFEQNVVQILQVCDIVLESLYESQEVVTSV